MKVVLGEECYVVLLEVAGAELRACADDLLGAAASIGGIVEEVVRVIDLVNEVAAELDRVVRQDLGKPDAGRQTCCCAGCSTRPPARPG